LSMVFSLSCLAGGVLVYSYSNGVLLNLFALALVGGSWSVPFIFSLRYRQIIYRLRLSAKTNNAISHRDVIGAIDDSRMNISRHEYHQEQSLVRIKRKISSLLAPQSCSKQEECEPILDILFVTSNGAGMGHISKIIAGAEKLESDCSFELLTLSLAYRNVARTGVTVHYFPSSEAAGETPTRWNRKFRDYFAQLLRQRRPRLVVFDGTWVYTGLTEMCRALDIPLVWMQRGMWKESVNETSVQRHDVASVADYVIIPGEFAG